MRLSSFTDYTLRVLIYLSTKEDKLSTVAEIADKYKISRNHLVKVVHNLSSIGIVKTYKGKGGGITLLISPEKINIGDLTRQLESETKLVECFGNSTNCIINPTCKLKKALILAEQNFYKTLQEYTLADITANKAKLSHILLA